MKLIIPSLILVALAVLLLLVRLLWDKSGRFPTGHVGDTPGLRERGIDCFRGQERESRRRATLRERIERGQ